MLPEWPPRAGRLLLDASVPGKPVPAGSKSGFALRRKDAAGIFRVIIRRDSAGNESAAVTVADQNSADLKKRRKQVLEALVDQLREQGYRRMVGPDVPLAVEIVFIQPRPATHYGSGKNAETLKDSAPAEPARKPDATKLWRALEDSLTGVLWTDDSRITRQRVEQAYCHRWEDHRTEIRLWALPETVGEARAAGNPVILRGQASLGLEVGGADESESDSRMGVDSGRPEPLGFPGL